MDTESDRCAVHRQLVDALQANMAAIDAEIKTAEAAVLSCANANKSSDKCRSERDAVRTIENSLRAAINAANKTGNWSAVTKLYKDLSDARAKLNLCMANSPGDPCADERGAVETLRQRRLDTDGKLTSAKAALEECERGSLGDKVDPSETTLRRGVMLACFVPWRQTWTLKGFGRGNLLQSLALAPQQEELVEINSWERRTRTLEQSSENEVEQNFEYAQTTRDTEDVFRELTSRHDFNWQVHGSLDATYQPIAATIALQVDGQVQNAQNLQNVSRNTENHLREVTVKSGAKIRSRRVTRITQTVETGREDRVIRRIRNPNMCHTLTFDYFETLAHYQIKTEFRQEQLRLVGLVSNPIWVEEFTRGIIRREEAALRNGLLDPGMAAGFDACRLLEAYARAKTHLERQEADAKMRRELDAERTQKPPTSGSGSPQDVTPQERALVSVMENIRDAVRLIREQATDALLDDIGAHRTVTETGRRRFQFWAFIQLCSAKLPAVFDALSQFASQTGQLPPEAAEKLVGALNRFSQGTTLGTLNDLSDVDKENYALAKAINKRKKAEWDWAWWSGRCREEGLYAVNDNNIAALCETLQRAFQEWRAKQAEGEFKKDKDQAIADAQSRQTQATVEDRLAMAFPLEDLATAMEREDALRSHLNAHRDHYSYVLFQSLSPAEQVTQLIEAAGAGLEVGSFEPRVIAMNGRYLAVPLTPTGVGKLGQFILNMETSLREELKKALSVPLPPDTVVVPTPGVSIATRLGTCSTCEDFLEESRSIELERLRAEAEVTKQEAIRRRERIAAKQLDDPVAPDSPLRVRLDNPSA